MMILDFAGAQAQKQAPHMTQPHLCLDAIRHGIQNGGLAGLCRVCVYLWGLLRPSLREQACYHIDEAKTICLLEAEGHAGFHDS